LKNRFAAAPFRRACKYTSTTSPYPKHFVGQALLVNGPPQVVLLAIDFDEHLVDEERIAVASMLSLQSPSV